MKITTFDPVIVTPAADNVVKLFEELGFVTSHNPTAKPPGASVPVFRMKHEKGFHIDILDKKDIPRDITNIRMNVDDFDEAFEILRSHGFIELYPDAPHDSESHRGCEMISPAGMTITLMQHIKK